MQHALPLSNQRSIVIALLACALGAAGATFTYAAVDGAFDGSSTGASAASTRPAPHAGVGAQAITPAPPAIRAPAHKGGGPPAELSPAMEAAIAKRTDPHGPASAAAPGR
jgi:hypothetical protein